MPFISNLKICKIMDEAPNKVYLQKNTTTDCYGEWWPEWFDGRAKEDDIEYIKTSIVMDAIKLAYGKVSMNPFDCSEAFEELITKIESL